MIFRVLSFWVLLDTARPVYIRDYWTRALATVVQVVTQVNELRAIRRSSAAVGKVSSAAGRASDTVTREATAHVSGGKELEYSPRGRLQYDMVPIALLARIECLNCYIKDANEGRGMVRHACMDSVVELN